MQVGGGDFAGTVEFVHPKSKWKLGDRVIAATKGWRWDDLDYGDPHQRMQKTSVFEGKLDPTPL